MWVEEEGRLYHACHCGTYLVKVDGWVDGAGRIGPSDFICIYTVLGLKWRGGRMLKKRRAGVVQGPSWHVIVHHLSYREYRSNIKGYIHIVFFVCLVQGPAFKKQKPFSLSLWVIYHITTEVCQEEDSGLSFYTLI